MASPRRGPPRPRPIKVEKPLVSRESPNHALGISRIMNLDRVFQTDLSSAERTAFARFYVNEALTTFSHPNDFHLIHHYLRGPLYDVLSTIARVCYSVPPAQRKNTRARCIELISTSSSWSETLARLARVTYLGIPAPRTTKKRRRSK